jgi:S1-C subfamily serine protease
MALKDTLKPGDTIELTIVRNGQEMKIKVVLKEDIPSDVTPANSSSPAENFI